jgi:hypothetical protein
MKSRLIGTVIATAAVTTCLALGAEQALGAQPTTVATADNSVQAPTDSELLQQIADNTAATNKSLTNINNNVKAMLKAEGKVSVNTGNTALRLKVVNTNLIALHTQLKSYFGFQSPEHTIYTGNEMRLIEETLCVINQSIEGHIDNLPPCGGK